MGYTTDFIGHIDIDPPLNEHEMQYLIAFSKTRHCERPGGEYAVAGNPYVCEDGLSTEQLNAVPPGQPGYWCHWEPCWDGCCLSFNGNEKFYQPVRWLTYLVEHFLMPDAVASRTGGSAFAGFTFDHVLEGMVIGCRRDTKELFAIEVTGNVVTEKALRPADPRYVDWPPLPYEAAIDRAESRRAQRRRRVRSDGVGSLADPRRG
jgi:hypothetical protein